MATFRLAGRSFDLDREDFERAVRGVEPGPISKYAVPLGGLRYPPKQVVALATRAGAAEFQTQEALRVLRLVGILPVPQEAAPRQRDGSDNNSSPRNRRRGR